MNDKTDGDPLELLYKRPGFLIRRAHQISVSMFQEEAGELGITTTQYGALYIIHHHPGIDQISLATLGGFDRSTTAMVVGRLEADGALRRESDSIDRRRKVLHLTIRGEQMLERMSAPARTAQERALAVFDPREAQHFLDLLSKFVDAHNDTVRTPIVPRRSTSFERSRRG